MFLNCWLIVPNSKYIRGLKVIKFHRVDSQGEGGHFPNAHQFTSYSLGFPPTILYSQTWQSTGYHRVCEENKGNVQECEEIQTKKTQTQTKPKKAYLS